MFELCRIFQKVRILSLTLGLLASGQANAAEIRWVQQQADDGLSVMLPNINIDKLIDDLALLKTELVKDERELAKQVEQKRIKTSDNVLSILMPGGLLYAAYKRHSYSQIVEQQNRLIDQVTEISSDLIDFSSTHRRVLVSNQ
jgi:hypothetical protein